MKRMFSLLLALTLVLSIFPVTASAGAATKHNFHEVTFKDNELDSFKFSFYWTTATIYDGGRLILMTKELEGSKGSGLGDFSNDGKYKDTYGSYEEAKANTEFGFIYATEPEQIYSGSTKTMSMSGLADLIDMEDGKPYYIYLWVQNGSHFYPDNLVCVIQMKNGKVKYSPGYIPEGKMANDYRNYYDEMVFLDIDKLNVVSVPGAGMTISSNASQTGLAANTAISTITVTANPGYYFPKSYKAPTLNGITVKRINETTLEITGTPIRDTVIYLPDATQDPSNMHSCTPTGWDYDGTNHWKFECSDSGCPNGKNTTKTNEGIHNHNLENNTKCVCGHTIAAEHTCVPSSTYYNQDPIAHWKYLCTVSGCDKGNHNKIDPSTRGEHIYDNINDLECNTCGYVRTAHTCTKSDWLYNNTTHWKNYCVVSDCVNRNSKINEGVHKFDSPQDTTCDCGYTRTAPAEKPETGDITNIPMWTMLFFGGIALLWVQLEQRKRQQF